LNDQSFRNHLKTGLDKIGFDYWEPRMPDCAVGNAVVWDPHTDRVVTVNIESGLVSVTDIAGNDVAWEEETERVAELLGLLARPWTWQAELITAAGIFPGETDIRSWFKFNDVEITEEQVDGECRVRSSLTYKDGQRVTGPTATEKDPVHALALVLLACNERRPE
jgi:hypothetical protein